MINLLSRSPQARSQTGNASQQNKLCYGQTIPQLVPVAVVRFNPSYRNADICQLFGISELELTKLRLELFGKGLLTLGVHYWQCDDGIRWSKSSLWRLAYRLDKSAIVTNPGRQAIALLPPATEFSLSSKQLADAVGIPPHKLHRLRRSSDALIQGEHYQQIRTATNTIAYQWSDAGLTTVRGLVGGDHV